MDGRICGWTNRFVNRLWMNRQLIDEFMDEYMGLQMNLWMNEHICGRIDEFKDGFMNKQTSLWMNLWMNRETNG